MSFNNFNSTDPFNFKSDLWSIQKTDKCSKTVQLSQADQRNLQLRGFVLGSFIGGGCFGQVYHAQYFELPCAVKVCDHMNVKLEELRMLYHFKHPHLMQLFSLYVTDLWKVLIFIELAEGGDLKSYMEQNKPWMSEDRARGYYLQFGDAFRYMHSFGFIHGDIHPGNILLDGSKQICKVADFGCVNRIFHPQTGQTVLLYRQRLSNDISSTGSVLCRMLNGTTNPSLKPTGEVFFQNQNLSKEACDVICAHFEWFTMRSLSFDEILSYPWFRV